MPFDLFHTPTLRSFYTCDHHFVSYGLFCSLYSYISCLSKIFIVLFYLFLPIFLAKTPLDSCHFCQAFLFGCRKLYASMYARKSSFGPLRIDTVVVFHILTYCEPEAMMGV